MRGRPVLDTHTRWPKIVIPPTNSQ